MAGTNAGLKRVMAGDPSLHYNDLLYIRRRYITKTRCVRPLPALPTPPLPSDVRTFGGRHDVVCLGCQKVWRVGSESHDRMAHPVRRQGGDDLLACGEKVGLYLFTAQALLVLEVAAMIEGVCGIARRWRSNSTTSIVMGKVKLPSRLAICWASTSCRVSRPLPAKAFAAQSRQRRCLPQPATDSDAAHQLGADPPAV